MKIGFFFVLFSFLIFASFLHAAAAPTVTASTTTPTVDQGQTATLTGSASGGTGGPYTYQWIATVVNGTTTYTAAYANSYCANAQSTTCSFATSTSTSTGIYRFELTAYDGAKTGTSPSVAITVHTALGTPTISPSSATLDSGQTQTLTASASGGTTPYSYQWYTGSGCTTIISGATSSTYGASPTSTTTYSVKVTDSASVPASTCSAVATLTVNPALNTPTISPSNPSIDNGQSITLTASVTGGTTPYSYQWYTGSGCTTIISGATSSTYGASPTSTTTYSVKVTDSATTPVSSCSTSSTVTVNPVLTTPSISPSSATLDSGQTQTLTASASGGTTPYSYQWYTGSGCTTIISGATSSTYGASPTSTTTYSVKVTDSANTPVSQCSTTSTLTVNPALNTPTISPSNPSIALGQSVTLTASVSGGTTPYSYQWYTGSACNTIISGATSSTYLASPSANTTYTVKVDDSATTPVSSCSTPSSVIVNLPLGTPSISPSNPTLDTGQSVTFNSVWSGGTTPYTAKLYSSTTASCNSGSTLLQTISSIASTSTIFSSQSPISSTYYCIIVNDSSSPSTSSQSSNSHVTVNPSLAINSLSASATFIDQEQNSTINAIISGGTSPYTYQWLATSADGSVFTADTGNILCSSPQSPICFFQTNSLTTTGIYKFKVEVTDAATTPLTSTSSPLSITLNTKLAPTVPIPLSHDLDQGQTAYISANEPITGTAPYTYQWLATTANGGTFSAIEANRLCVSPNSLSCQFITNTLTSPGTYQFKLQIVDSATHPSTVFTNSSQAIVSNAMSASAPLPNYNYLDQGQSINLVVNSLSGGTPPYSYQWLELDPITSLFSNASDCASPHSTSCSFTTNSLTRLGTYSFKLQITDSPDTPTSFTTPGEYFTLNPALTINIITPSTSHIDAGQSVSVDGATPTTGTSPYTYQWYAKAPGSGSYSATEGNSLCASPQSIQCDFNTTSSTTLGTYNFEISAKDSADTPTTALSTNVSITVNAPLAVTAPTPASQKVDQGQTATLTAIMPSGGVPPYSYQWTASTDNGTTYSVATSYCSTSSGSGLSGGATVTCTFNTHTSTTPGNYLFKIGVMDSSLNASYNYSNPANVLLYAVPTVSLTSNVSQVNVNGSVLLTMAIPSGVGAGPFTLQLYDGVSLIHSDTLSSGGGSKTFAYTINTISVRNFTVVANDTGTKTAYVFSSNTLSITSLAPNVTTTTTTIPVTTTVPAGNTTTIPGGGGVAPTGGGTGSSTGVSSGGALIGTEANGFLVSSMSVSSTADLRLNGDAFNLVLNFITPDYMGITINGVRYTLSKNDTILLASSPSSFYYLRVINISVLPVRPSASVELYRIPNNQSSIVVYATNSTTRLVISNSSPTYVNLFSLGSILSISSSISGNVLLKVVNLTSSNSLPQGPNNYQRFLVLNISTLSETLGAKTTINVTAAYDCLSHPNDTAPFILSNETWVPISNYTTDPLSCHISFIINSDPIIGLFEATQPQNITTTSEMKVIISMLPPMGSPIYPITILGILAIVGILVYKYREKVRIFAEKLKQQY